MTGSTNRSLFLGGRYAQAFEELVAAREAAGSLHLKVILETGELGSYDRVRRASVLIKLCRGRIDRARIDVEGIVTDLESFGVVEPGSGDE